jgi:ABC-type Fe3+ transport system substrate-binding protein
MAPPLFGEDSMARTGTAASNRREPPGGLAFLTWPRWASCDRRANPRCIAAGFFAAAAAICLLLTYAPKAKAADAALIAAARKEGQVVWYTTLIVNQIVRPLQMAFEKQYGVKLNYSRADDAPTVLKLLNEARAGRVQADIFDSLYGMIAVRRAGLLASYRPPNIDDIPEELKDKDGYWTGLLVYVFAPGINVNLVPPGRAPKTLDDLLDLQWKGRMAWHAGSIAGATGFIGAILAGMGEERGMTYLRALAQQHIINVEASSRAVLDQVIAGEYPMALMTFINHAVISARKGAPAAWLKIEPMPVALDAVSLLKDAPHPNAARLLIDFLASPQGQEVFRQADYLPALPTVPTMTPGLRPADGKFAATYLRPAEIDRSVARWSKVEQELFR